MLQQLMFTLMITLSVRSQALEIYSAISTEPITLRVSTLRFPKSYSFARDQFRSWGQEYSHSQSGNIKVESHTDNDLTIDYTLFPGTNSNSKLVIITSGIHGAEAPTGHTVQELVFREFIQTNKFKDLCFLFVHSLNPYGYKYFRRTTENNIDLNRNFATVEEFKSNNESYEHLKHLLQPTIPAQSSWISRLFFYSKAIYYNLRFGKNIFLKSISGQYRESQGIFFGGAKVEPQILQLQEKIQEIAAPYSLIYHIDLHTGFGERGNLHLFGSDGLDPESKKRMLDFFKGFQIDTGKDKDFYSTSGDFSDWMWNTFKKQKIISMTFEFGTQDSQTLWGGLNSLWTTVTENQGNQFGFVSLEDQWRVKKNYEELFNPQSKQWQKQILEQSYNIFAKTLDRFEKFE